MQVKIDTLVLNSNINNYILFYKIKYPKYYTISMIYLYLFINYFC